MNSHIKSLEISSQFLVLLKNNLRGKKLVESLWHFIATNKRSRPVYQQRGWGGATCETKDNKLCLWLKNIENYQPFHPLELRLEENSFFLKAFHLEMSKTDMIVPVGTQGTSQRLVYYIEPYEESGQSKKGLNVQCENHSTVKIHKTFLTK